MAVRKKDAIKHRNKHKGTKQDEVKETTNEDDRGRAAGLGCIVRTGEEGQ